jgi:hypothetical protein
VPARSYFYSAPDEDSSTAKYVLRGDIIYAEAEIEDFIKTRFFNSDGEPVAAWLKKTDVRLKSPRPAITTQNRKTVEPKVAAVPKETNEPAQPATQNTAATSTRPIASTGVVRVDTTYFFDSPDLTQRRRAFCIRGDKLKLSDSSEKAVFATFVNWEKVRTTGWIKKEDLTIR